MKYIYLFCKKLNQKASKEKLMKCIKFKKKRIQRTVQFNLKSKIIYKF